MLSSTEIIADKVQSKGEGDSNRAGEVVVGFVFLYRLRHYRVTWL